MTLSSTKLLNMSILVSVIVIYLLNGYAMLRHERNADIWEQTPLVRQGNHILYVLIWPLPFFVNRIAPLLLENQRLKYQANQAALLKIKLNNEKVELWRNGFQYGQRESILMALNYIATRFQTTKALPGELQFITKAGKQLGINIENESYRLLTHSIGYGYIGHLIMLSDSNKDYFYAVVKELLTASEKHRDEKAEIAMSIVSDMGGSMSRYRLITNSSDDFPIG